MISMTANVAEVAASLDAVERRQIPQALVWALNDTAYAVLKGVQGEMDRRFDRPTRFTKNALMVWRATKRTLTAEVKERPSAGRRHYLKVEERGGARPQTGMDRLFATRLPFAGVIRSVIPATGSPFEAAKLDAFGNWSVGERNKVMSQVRVGRDVGFVSNRTARSERRRVRRGGVKYFVPQHGLAPGVYRRNRPGDIPVRVLKFTDKAPRYRPRLGLFDQAEATVRDEFERHFARALAKALATAR